MNSHIMNREQLVIWLAGLFEGEGTFNFYKEVARKISITSTDKDVLDKIQENFGGGICSTTKKFDHWKQAYIWYISGLEAKNIVESIKPYLLSRRSIRAQEWLDSFTSLYDIRENKKNSYEIKKSRILELRSQGLKHREIAEIVDLDRTTVSKYLSANGV